MYKTVLKSTISAALVFGFAVTNISASAHEGDHDDVNKAALAKALDAGHRSAGNVARDKYRHPEGTINFFNISQNMVVGEIWPGGAGFYAEILAPYLKDNGGYHPITRDLAYAKGGYNKGVHTLKAKFEANPSYGSYSPVDMAQENPDIGMKGQFDMILTFRNVHNWSMGKYDGPFLKAINTALKMGGKVGVVDHRLDGPLEGEEVRGGYMATSYIVNLFEAHGFKLAGSSEVNANPKDDKDHPEGVWTLPPSLAKGDVDRAEYLAVGESDRMTLMFEKVSN